jgi:hypothetical protein
LALDYLIGCHINEVFFSEISVQDAKFQNDLDGNNGFSIVFFNQKTELSPKKSQNRKGG